MMHDVYVWAKKLTFDAVRVQINNKVKKNDVRYIFESTDIM